MGALELINRILLSFHSSRAPRCCNCLPQMQWCRITERNLVPIQFGKNWKDIRNFFAQSFSAANLISKYLWAFVSLGDSYLKYELWTNEYKSTGTSFYSAIAQPQTRTQLVKSFNWIIWSCEMNQFLYRKDTNRITCKRDLENEKLYFWNSIICWTV